MLLSVKKETLYVLNFQRCLCNLESLESDTRTSQKFEINHVFQTVQKVPRKGKKNNKNNCLPLKVTCNIYTSKKGGFTTSPTRIFVNQLLQKRFFFQRIFRALKHTKGVSHRSQSRFSSSHLKKKFFWKGCAIHVEKKRFSNEKEMVQKRFVL